MNTTRVAVLVITFVSVLGLFGYRASLDCIPERCGVVMKHDSERP